MRAGLNVDMDRVDREFRRSIVADQGGGIMERAATPDFDEEPMPLRPWLREVLRVPPLSEIQEDAVLHAERIYFEPTFDALGWPRKRVVNEIPLAWGKGSGKDHISRILLSRGVYLCYCLASPQGYFGMPGSDTIHFTNVATSSNQAKYVFFEPWVEMLKRSPWFRQIMEPMAAAIKFDKLLLAQSGHSKSESQEGQNLLMAVLDEWAGFKTAAELSVQKRLNEREPAQSATGIYGTARSSILSRFPETGKLIAISFTRFKNDPIDAKVKEATRDFERRGMASRMYGSRAATWEVNPLRSRSDFDEAYETDPIDAQCRYECKPVASPHRYFQNLLAVRRALGVSFDLEPEEVDRQPAELRLPIEYYWGPDRDNPEMVEGWQVRFDLSLLPRHDKECAIHFDLGISQDLAGMAMSHIEGWRKAEHTIRDPHTGLEEVIEVPRPIIATDFVIAFEQQRGDPSRGIGSSDIQIRWLRSLIFLLINEGWKIGMVTGDGYQSTDMFQLLESRGIDTELYSLDRKTEGYDILKNSVYSGDVEAPFHPRLYSELESLIKLSDSKIDHQAGSSKDMADAWAGSVRGALRMLELRGAGPDTEIWAGGSIESIVELSRASAGGQGVATYNEGSTDDNGFFVGGGVSWRK